MILYSPTLSQSGRKKIYTNTPITLDTVKAVVEKAMETHRINAERCNYLMKYRAGEQEVPHTQVSEDEIWNPVVINNAAAVVDFKNAYTLGTPINFVLRGDRENKNDDGRIKRLNDIFTVLSKPALDLENGDTLFTCGVAYQAIMPDANNTVAIYNLDPRSTFLIYSNDIYKKVVASVTFTIENTSAMEKTHYVVHTPQTVYEWTDEGAIKTTPNGIGMIPVVEYATITRQGAFENAISVLDALNITASERSTAISKFVSAFVWMDNVDIDDEKMAELKTGGAVLTSSESGRQATIKYVTAELNQDGTQSYADDLYDKMLVICKMPGREQASGGNTQGAVIFGASGWAEAENDAKTISALIGRSERALLNLVLHICHNSKDDPVPGLNGIDVDISFTRNQTANLISKTQALLNMLTAGVHPRKALEKCDIFDDPELVYEESVEYLKKWLDPEQWDTAESEALDDGTNSGQINKIS